MDHLAGGDKAVAGIDHARPLIDGLTRQQGHNGVRTDLGVLVGHVTGFRHLRRGERRIAEHVDVLLGLRFAGQEIHFAPAFVGGDETSGFGDLRRLLWWDDIEHVGLHAAEQQLGRTGFHIDILQFAAGLVIDDAAV